LGLSTNKQKITGEVIVTNTVIIVPSITLQRYKHRQKSKKKNKQSPCSHQVNSKKSKQFDIV
jgi:hypothetical protein